MVSRTLAISLAMVAVFWFGDSMVVGLWSFGSSSRGSEYDSEVVCSGFRFGFSQVRVQV